MSSEQKQVIRKASNDSTIINLSSRLLNENEVSVVSKGLKFIPTTNALDVVKVKNDLVKRDG